MRSANRSDTLIQLAYYHLTDGYPDQLPNKIDEVAFCPMTPKQIEVYKRILNTEAVQNMIRKDELCDCGSRQK